MNYYETLYIIHPALDAGRVKEMVLSVNETLEKTGGSVSAVDVWGKKKLAYEIDKQKYGTYVLVQFTGDGSGNANFNVELEHNPNVLAYLTIKIEEHKIIKNAISLDEQLSGANTGGDKKVKGESSNQPSTDKESETVAEEVVEDKDASVEEVVEDKDASAEEVVEDKDASTEEVVEGQDDSAEESSDTDNDSDDSKEANADEAKDKE